MYHRFKGQSVGAEAPFAYLRRADGESRGRLHDRNTHVESQPCQGYPDITQFELI
jgi:hypothetical protein